MSQLPESEPAIRYKPDAPAGDRTPIALIGCGRITRDHLKAYHRQELNVVALCDLDIEKARERQQEFYPDAIVCTDYHQILKRDDVAVVDIALHPPDRPPVIKAAIQAGKHVLSQKPFVLDLDIGERLCDLADKHNVYLAVNQNGRWAPHFSFIRNAVAGGYLGEVVGSHLSVHWDHSWVQGTEFEKVKHLVLYDYAIHWFDILRCFLPNRTPVRVYASTVRSPVQTVMPSLLGQVLIEWDAAQSTLAFDANVPFGTQDRTFVSGTHGTASSVGPGNKIQQVTLTTEHGLYQPALEGSWFPDAFLGPMGELLNAIRDRRLPSINGRDNLKSLALCFAAVESADRHLPIIPGSIRRLPE